MFFVHVAVFLLVLSWTPGFVSGASAESYIAGHVGFVLAENLLGATSTSLNTAGITPGTKISDLDLFDAYMYGAKLGYFSATRPWLGVETEVYSATPHVPQQIVIVAVPGSATGATLPGTSLRITTVAFNLLTRETTLGDFQPYGGIGPAIFIAHGSGLGISSTHAGLGLNLEAGGRFFLSKHLALFGEFKFNKAEVKFAGLSGDYSAQLFTGGVSFHFY